MNLQTIWENKTYRGLIPDQDTLINQTNGGQTSPVRFQFRYIHGLPSFGSDKAESSRGEYCLPLLKSNIFFVRYFIMYWLLSDTLCPLLYFEQLGQRKEGGSIHFSDA